jgi:alpha-glucosidase
LGNHRYQIGFSGDTISVWESLAFQPWFTATAANVGYAYWSHDIGGHMPGVVAPELYTRWIQFGIYSPILRTHTTKNPNAERRIWAYPEPYSDIMRDLFHERYAIIPYLYSEARSTYDTGLAFLRPLYYDWPEANEAYDMKNEYVFGSQMIVNPIVTPGDKITGRVQQELWMPKGEWVEKDTGTHLTDPAKMQRDFSIAQVPVYVRAGAIVPMAPPMQYTSQKPVDPLIVMVYPLKNGEASTYSLYQDSGDTRAYQTGQFARTELSAVEKGNELTITIGAVRGSFPGMRTERAYEVRLPADWPPEALSVNGQTADYKPKSSAPGWTHGGTSLETGVPSWRFEGNTLTTVISTRSMPVTEGVNIKVTRCAELSGAYEPPRRAQRVRWSDDASQRCALHAATAWPIGSVPDEVEDAAQTGEKLGYYPDTALQILARYRDVPPKAKAKVYEMVKAGISSQQRQALEKRFGDTWHNPEVQAAVADYANKLKRARTDINDAIGAR